MIDISQMICEIGLLETICMMQKVGFDNIDERVLSCIPATVSLSDVGQRLSHITECVMESGKQDILLLSPEIALLERCSSRSNVRFRIIIPRDMDEDVASRVKCNIPNTMSVSFIDEPFYPSGFYPSNGLIMAFGFQNGDRAMLLPSTYRILEHYRGFMGRKVFVPINGRGQCIRAAAWVECYKGAYFNEQY